MSLEIAPSTSRPSSPVSVNEVMPAAKTVTLTGLFGGTFFAPKAGDAVMRTVLPAMVDGAVVLAGAVPDGEPAGGAVLLSAGAWTWLAATCPDVTVTTTTSGSDEEQADTVSARAATSADTPAIRRPNSWTERIRTLFSTSSCRRAGRTQRPGGPEDPATTVVVGREVHV